jgi:putative Mn2+ efflux pump MntP
VGDEIIIGIMLIIIGVEAVKVAVDKDDKDDDEMRRLAKERTLLRAVTLAVRKRRSRCAVTAAAVDMIDDEYDE